MSKIQKTLSFIILMGSIFFATSTQAEDYSCRILGALQDDVWVIIYDADADGNRGPIIWEGKIEPRQEIPITSTDGHIRFDSTVDPDQPYGGDQSRGCYNNKRLVVN